MLMAFITNALVRMRDEEEGQAMIEYALLAFLISIAAVAVLVLIGPQLVTVFQGVLDGISP
jgi:pilus assembly protein Flp/PilA